MSHSAPNPTAPLARLPLPARTTLRTVFLDRDGVINRKLPEGEYVSSLDRFTLLPGVPQAIARLNLAGLRVLVVTNQRGVALGKYSLSTIGSLHAHLAQLLSTHGATIDAFYVCPHDKAACDCRKPAPGLFLQAQRQFPQINPATSVLIGDSYSDILFGAQLGIATIFIEGDPTHRKPGAEKALTLATATAPDLPAAISLLLDEPA